MSAPKLVLYHFESCPFCIRVRDKIQQLQLAVTEKDILKNPSDREQLLKDTGRQTVPCLYIDGKPMHESSDIIQWLEEHRDELQKRSQ